MCFVYLIRQLKTKTATEIINVNIGNLKLSSIHDCFCRASMMATAHWYTILTIDHVINIELITIKMMLITFIFLSFYMLVFKCKDTDNFHK